MTAISCHQRVRPSADRALPCCGSGFGAAKAVVPACVAATAGSWVGGGKPWVSFRESRQARDVGHGRAALILLRAVGRRGGGARARRSSRAAPGSRFRPTRTVESDGTVTVLSLLATRLVRRRRKAHAMHSRLGRAEPFAGGAPRPSRARSGPPSRPMRVRGWPPGPYATGWWRPHSGPRSRPGTSKAGHGIQRRPALVQQPGTAGGPIWPSSRRPAARDDRPQNGG